ncbi:MAG: DUF4041 domain-containing protein [Evtepia sp.]
MEFFGGFVVLEIIILVFYLKKIKGQQQHLKDQQISIDIQLANVNRQTEQQLEKIKTEQQHLTDQQSSIETQRADANRQTEQQRKEADSYCQKARDQADVIYQKIDEIKQEKTVLQSELNSLALDTVVGMVRIDAYETMKSDEIKNSLALLRTKQDDLIQSGDALILSNESTSKRIVDSQKKQILRCFNAECASIIQNVTVKNVDASRTKIQRAFDANNKIFLVDGVQISQAYIAAKFEELSLLYAYILKEDDEREQRKAIREQMLEEEKVRREIERAKQKIEKEETQFTNEVNKLMQYMQKSKDDIERKLYIDKIADLEENLKRLQQDKDDVLHREANTRAGFVYIISNIGSFGEDIYKIGMTRRLEPLERINELSSASVPFAFDVHALIFSDDAPTLETTLHQTFQDYRVNKVNLRKEFFHVDLDQIKSVVTNKHNATVKFLDLPDASEYRKTLDLETIGVAMSN